MKNVFRTIFIIAVILTMNGCLLFNTVSYEINLDDEKSGDVTVTVNDIKSNAINSAELDEDKSNLFEFLLQSEDFLNQMADEGKHFTERNLYIDNGRLVGEANYTFEDVTKVEGIVYEEPFYYLTLSLSDSIVSTNGEIIVSSEHKRIMWDNSIKTLKFEMFGEETGGDNLTGMAQFYENE